MRNFITYINLKIFILFLLIIYNFHFSFGQVVDLTSYLPKNYSTNGNVDYTIYLQKGIDENSDLIMPNFSILINEEGLNLRSNQSIIFQQKSKLIMKPNSKARNGLLNLKNVDNVIIKNAVLEGDRYKHKNKLGEWGMGINVLSSKNIKIINPYISKFWGDGIYIGEIHYTEIKNFKINEIFCQDVVIKDGCLDGNRRNGISIINVKGLLIENIMIMNNSGIAPMAGICIEPNGSSQFLENIIISKVTAKNNPQFGIAYVPSRYYGVKKRNVSIKINDCVIQNSKTGLYIGGATASKVKKKNVKLEGKIEINNCAIYSCEIPVRSGSNQKFNPNVRMHGMRFFKDKSNRDLLEEKKTKAKLAKVGININ